MGIVGALANMQRDRLLAELTPRTLDWWDGLGKHLEDDRLENAGGDQLEGRRDAALVQEDDPGQGRPVGDAWSSPLGFGGSGANNSSIRAYSSSLTSGLVMFPFCRQPRYSQGHSFESRS